MAEELDTFAIKAGTLARTDFKDEQDRLEEYSKTQSVSSQAGESIKGEKGDAGPAGPAGSPALDETIVVPSGATQVVATKSVEGAILQLRKEGTLPTGAGGVGLGAISGAIITFVFGGSLAAIPDTGYIVLVYRFA